MTRALAIVLGAVLALAPAAAAQPIAPDPALPGAAVGSGSGSGSATAPIIIDAPFIIGQPEVTGSAAPSEVRVGEIFTLYVTAIYGADVVVNLPATLALGGVLEESPGRSARDSKRADGKLVREWQVPLRAWMLGDVQLPPVAVTFVTPAGSGQIMTPAIPLKIIATVADADDPTQLRDMAKPRTLTKRDWTLAIIAAVVLAAIIGLVLFLRWRKRRRTRPVRSVPRAAPVASQSLIRQLDGPAAEALRALAAIEGSGVLESDPTLGVERMVQVVRTFLGRRGGFAQADLTTAELERELTRRRAVEPDLLPRVHRWLAVGDRVKYAGVPPDTAEAHDVLGDARALVMEAAGVNMTDEASASGSMGGAA